MAAGHRHAGGRRARPEARQERPEGRRARSSSPGWRIGVIVAVLAVCGTVAAFVVRAATGGNAQPKPLSTMMASQQPVGLAGAGPQPGSPQLLVAPRAKGLAFLSGAAASGVQASQQWQADRMTDNSYVLVYVPDGECLAAASSPSGTAQADLESCNLQLSQRWSHPYRGKDSLGRDYWQLRSMADGRCLAAAASWTPGTAAGLLPCRTSLPWQQLIAFWSAY